jgi:hypothetical protein
MIDLGIAEQSVENPLAHRVGKADIGLVGEHDDADPLVALQTDIGAERGRAAIVPDDVAVRCHLDDSPPKPQTKTRIIA